MFCEVCVVCPKHVYVLCVLCLLYVCFICVSYRLRIVCVLFGKWWYDRHMYYVLNGMCYLVSLCVLCVDELVLCVLFECCVCGVCRWFVFMLCVLCLCSWTEVSRGVNMSEGTFVTLSFVLCYLSSPCFSACISEGGLSWGTSLKLPISAYSSISQHSS